MAPASNAGRGAGLARFLREFAGVRPGMRSGVMFGMPALYAGRRLVAFVAEDGLVCRLAAEEVRSRRVTSRPLVMKGRPSRGWTVLRPKAPGDLREVAVLIELATVRALHAGPGRARQVRKRR